MYINPESGVNDVINIVSILIIQFDDTLLHYAVFQGKINLVTYLMQLKADPNRKNKRGRTPIDIAVSKKDTKMISLLNKE